MTTMKEKIDELWMGTVEVKPEDYDFYDKREGDDWNISVERTDGEIENEDFFPQMNYRYPVPDLDRKNHSNNKIKKAVDEAGSLTLIEDLESNEKYLALTGGGMDLSWDIVKGYINLGFTPPVHFCRDLPGMAGMKLSIENEGAILGCRRSLEAQSGWNKSGLKKLDDLEKTLRANLKRR